MNWCLAATFMANETLLKLVLKGAFDWDWLDGWMLLKGNWNATKTEAGWDWRRLDVVIHWFCFGGVVCNNGPVEKMVRMEGWIDGWMDGWMGPCGWVGGRVDKRLGKRIAVRCIVTIWQTQRYNSSCDSSISGSFSLHPHHPHYPHHPKYQLDWVHWNWI